MKKKLYNHMLDVAFTIVTNKKNWEKIPPEEIISALKERVRCLENNPSEAGEAFGYSDTYEI